MILLERDYVWEPEDSQTDVRFDFTCPKNVSRLRIYFSYAPGKEEREEICIPQIGQALARYYDRYPPAMQPMTAEQFLPVKNLITLSLEREGIYLGNAHRWAPEQMHEITAERASLGFVPPQKLAGSWSGMLHLHEIISSRCTGTLRIEGTELNWLPVELHTHTQHSDGDFTVEELTAAAKRRGFAAVACTDHNAFSGVEELKRFAAREGIIGIPGIEWTTYWGHMLVLGEQGYTDWRGVKKEEIGDAMQSIHANGGILGVAHPFALGNPVNTGYHWEFHVSDWDAVDFLEVWSRDDAPVKVQSLRAMELWEQLLQRGCRITATSGRDWHREDTRPYAHTYVGISGAFTAPAVLDAVRRGQVCLTAGPLLTMCAYSEDGARTEIGGEVCASAALELELSVDADTMPNDWDREQVQADEIRIVHNGAEIYRCSMSAYQRIRVPVSRGWLRADLIGSFHGRKEQCIALTNPIFVR